MTAAKGRGFRGGNAQRRGVVGSAIALGTNMAGGMALFTYLGYQIDQHRGHGRAATLAGMFLGLIYGGYEVWKLVRQLQATARETGLETPDDVP